MPHSSAVRTFDVRHLQLARALFALVAAIMITFSPDHSAGVGLGVFSGFAIATAIVLFTAAWLVYPAGRRGAPVLLGAISLVAGMITGLVGLRSATMFFVVVIAWALVSGAAELVAGILARRGAAGEPSHARDAIVVGAITILLGLGLLLVAPGYQLDYFIDDAGQWFTLTGITIAVGIFGGYAAIIGVYLAIAGFSPRTNPAVAPASADTEDAS